MTEAVVRRCSSKQVFLKTGLQTCNFIKAPEHAHIFSKYSQNLNISGRCWACYTKNDFPIIFPKYKKSHFLTSIEILDFAFQIKPVLFETQIFLMRLKKIYWNWGIYFVFKSKHAQIDKYANCYLNKFILHVKILVKF